ncbi:hypothetical protein SDC9_49698 [bioreactor metagenome]|uniref:Uncharacterized protein n=1 Tax=bioreactor metagenome TaxID=1076179 RepID=A0A644WIU0_9ZZZZ
MGPEPRLCEIAAGPAQVGPVVPWSHETGFDLDRHGEGVQVKIHLAHLALAMKPAIVVEALAWHLGH